MKTLHFLVNSKEGFFSCSCLTKTSLGDEWRDGARIIKLAVEVLCELNPVAFHNYC